MIIKNGAVFKAEGEFNLNSIKIDGDRIIEISNDTFDEINEDVIDATDMYVIPGLIDIHLHGCNGHDFCEGSNEAFKKISEYELMNGITSICLASMTIDEANLSKIFENVATYHNNGGADIVGINMEGPFLSIKKAGAQNMKYLQKPDVDMFNRLQQASKGLIKLVDMAPEIEGGLDFIEEVSPFVRVSLAHTEADYSLSKEAFNKGASQVTHLYNAMRPFHHREPGLIGAAIDEKDVFVELITDGIHVADATVRASFKLFGDDRIILISDSMEACGMPDGDYQLGGQKVIVNGTKASLEDGTIAGSVTNLMDCLKIAVKNMNIPFESAIKCATANPAKSIGIYNQCGSLDIGKRADVVILDKDFSIKYIVKDGRIIKQ